MNILAFLAHCTESRECANVLANSIFLREILALAAEVGSVSQSVGLMLLFASIVRNSSEVNPENLTDEALKPLERLMSESGRLARMAIAAIGEVAIRNPRFTSPITLSNLKTADEIVRNRSLRTVSNLLIESSEFFNLRELEGILIDFEVGDDLHAFGTCLANLFSHIDTQFPDRIELLLHKLMETAPNVAITLAARTGLLPKLRDDLRKLCQNFSGQASLACCTAFQDDLDGFLPMASHFFSSLSQLESTYVDHVVIWVNSIADVILRTVQERKDYQLIEILLRALLMDEKIWTRRLEAKFSEVLTVANFDDPHAELLLRILKIALSHNLCDVILLTNAAHGSESSIAETVLELFADATTHPDECFTEFVIRKVVPTIKKDIIFQDAALKLFLNLVTTNPSKALPAIVDKATLPLILGRMADSTAASGLAVRIVKQGRTTIDMLVKAGLIGAVSEAMWSPNAGGAVELLLSVFSALATARGKSRRVELAISAVAPLAALAPRCAEMIPESPHAGMTLSRLMYLFTPREGDAPYAGCFEVLARAMPRAGESLDELVQTMAFVAKRNEAVRKAMRQAPDFTQALMALVAEAPSGLAAGVMTLIRELDR
jgi:hypothetical protein